MGKPVRIMDVARRMIRLAGYSPETDIKIEIVGCRPGEKLFEELFDSAEQRTVSAVPGVFSAVPVPVSIARLQKGFEDLRASAQAGDTASLVAIIKDILPNYQGGGAQQAVAASRAEPRQPHARELRSIGPALPAVAGMST
jgi:O-antigen biosynthesis protein WbqV